MQEDAQNVDGVPYNVFPALLGRLRRVFRASVRWLNI